MVIVQSLRLQKHLPKTMVKNCGGVPINSSLSLSAFVWLCMFIANLGLLDCSISIEIYLFLLVVSDT